MFFHGSGIIRGNRIDLEKDPGLPDGTKVTVQVEPTLPGNAGEDFSHSIMRLCGAWKDESLDAIFEQIIENRENRPVRQVPTLDSPS